MKIERLIKKHILRSCFKGKIIVIYGPRRVGKTTLVKEIGVELGGELYLSCDEPTVRNMLTKKDTPSLLSVIKGYKTIIIDEAQRIEDIGLTLKQLADSNLDNVQIIATGSSSFELSNKIKEPLTGRSFEFHLLPFSIEEIKPYENRIIQESTLNDRIIHGLYPEIVLGKENREKILFSIANNYLYKDILTYEGIRKPDILEKILSILAISVGSEISFNEISNTLDIAKQTVNSYVKILEQAFIIYSVKPFHKNLRSEMTKKRKIYFYDTGIRNTILNDMKDIELRIDKGALWENFVMNERIKKAFNDDDFQKKFYFWRTTDGQEIDLVEEKNTELKIFEIKWQEKNIKLPAKWKESYGETDIKIICRKNFLDMQ